MRKLNCQTCGGIMKRKTIKSGRATGCAIACGVFVLGILICFIPIVGWVVGPVMCLCAAFIGAKRQKVWKCRKCGAIVQRG